MSERGDIVVLGGGGHAVLVATLLQRIGYRVRGYVSPHPHVGEGRGVLSRWLGNDDWLARSGPKTGPLANGIGSTARPDARRAAYLMALHAGHTFLDVIHEAAVLDEQATVGTGVQILALAVVQPGCDIGDNVLINTGAIVEHGTTVGRHAHIAPRACLCGDVRIGESVHVGAGAIVLEGRSIADGAVIGAGSIVTRNVTSNAVVVGSPAREIARSTSA